MALMPKRMKFRKSQRGKVRGAAQRGNTVAFGEYGLQSLETGWLTGRQIEAGRMCASQFMQREGRVYIRVFPHKPVSGKPLETGVDLTGVQLPGTAEQSPEEVV